MFTLFFAKSYFSEINFFIHVKRRHSSSWCHQALLWTDCWCSHCFPHRCNKLSNDNHLREEGWSWVLAGEGPVSPMVGDVAVAEWGDWPCCMPSKGAAWEASWSTHFPVSFSFLFTSELQPLEGWVFSPQMIISGDTALCTHSGKSPTWFQNEGDSAD